MHLTFSLSLSNLDNNCLDISSMASPKEGENGEGGANNSDEPSQTNHGIGQEDEAAADSKCTKIGGDGNETVELNVDAVSDNTKPVEAPEVCSRLYKLERIFGPRQFGDIMGFFK